MSRINGFAPLVGEQPRVLILGSMPSVASLDKQQYYGKPQNAFWRIMGELFGAGPDLPYAKRAVVLTDSGIAVWDVLASCVRPGSLDSAIDMRSAAVNEFNPFLQAHADIRHVFFNGRKAEEVYNRRVLAEAIMLRPDMRYVCLPSTSPAMATLKFSEKLKRWNVVAEALHNACK